MDLTSPSVMLAGMMLRLNSFAMLWDIVNHSFVSLYIARSPVVDMASRSSLIPVYYSSGGVAVRGLIPTSQPAIENVMCPMNATSTSNCSFSPPITPRCFESFNAAGIQCIGM